jgi:Flp pilus assembly protein TadB
MIQWALFGLGVALLLISPLVGAIPGPGGIVIAGIGLALVLRTSMWAKRRYVRFKRRQPKVGQWMDLALRRRSARRRNGLRKAVRSGAGN